MGPFSAIFITVMSGVLVAVLVQIVIKFILDPLKEFQNTRFQIAFQLDFYAKEIMNPGQLKNDSDNLGDNGIEILNKRDEKFSQISEELRKSAMLLRFQPAVIYKYDSISRWIELPSKKELNLASRELVGLSNSLHDGTWQINTKRDNSIRTHLRLPE